MSLIQTSDAHPLISRYRRPFPCLPWDRNHAGALSFNLDWQGLLSGDPQLRDNQSMVWPGAGTWLGGKTLEPSALLSLPFPETHLRTQKRWEPQPNGPGVQGVCDPAGLPTSPSEKGSDSVSKRGSQLVAGQKEADWALVRLGHWCSIQAERTDPSCLVVPRLRRA